MKHPAPARRRRERPDASWKNRSESLHYQPAPHHRHTPGAMSVMTVGLTASRDAPRCVGPAAGRVCFPAAKAGRTGHWRGLGATFGLGGAGRGAGLFRSPSQARRQARVAPTLRQCLGNHSKGCGTPMSTQTITAEAVGLDHHSGCYRTSGYYLNHHNRCCRTSGYYLNHHNRCCGPPMPTYIITADAVGHQCRPCSKNVELWQTMRNIISLEPQAPEKVQIPPQTREQ
eukprot:gene10132-biopygen9305